MASAGSVTIDFAAETAKFTSELKKVRSELKSLQTSVGSIGTQLGKAGNAIKGFVAGFALVATVKATISAVAAATAESEAAVSQLESALKSAGKSVASESPRFQKFATDMQGVTTFTDEAVIGVETLLLSFKGLSGDTILRASTAVLDVSTRLGTDLKGASIAVGKALQDPIKGMTALGRLGIVVSDSQKDFIKTLVNSGQTAKAQAIILKELEDRFGGAAAAARDNFSGALTGLKNSLGDLLEVKGGLPETTANLNEMSRILQDPGVRAGADQLFGSLIRGASASAKFIAEIAGGLAILAGKGTNEGANLSREADILIQSRNRILQSVGGQLEKIGPGFRKELDTIDRRLAEIVAREREIDALAVRVARSQSRTEGGHGQITGGAENVIGETPEQRSARITRELAVEKARLAAGLQNIEQLSAESDRILDEIAEREKPIAAAREESLKTFAQRELDILSDSVERKIDIERQYVDSAIAERRRLADIEAKTAQEAVQVRQDTALKSIAILAFMVQGQKNANKALEIANKAQALRQIFIDSKAAAVSALKIYGPTPLGYAAAAAAIAFGALQAKGILAASTTFSVGGSGPSVGGASSAAVAPEQSVSTDAQSAITVQINGVISAPLIDQLVSGLEDKFRRGVIVIQGGSNQANAIRRGT